MNYWPTQQLIGSGKMWRSHRNAIARLYHDSTPLPYPTLAALHELACTVPACTSMVLIRSEDAPIRRVYLKHPTQENWIALERGGFFATKEDFGFVMDALH